MYDDVRNDIYKKKTIGVDLSIWMRIGWAVSVVVDCIVSVWSISTIHSIQYLPLAEGGVGRARQLMIDEAGSSTGCHLSHKTPQFLHRPPPRYRCGEPPSAGRCLLLRWKTASHLNFKPRSDYFYFLSFCGRLFFVPTHIICYVAYLSQISVSQ